MEQYTLSEEADSLLEINGELSSRPVTNYEYEDKVGLQREVYTFSKKSILHISMTPKILCHTKKDLEVMSPDPLRRVMNLVCTTTYLKSVKVRCYDQKSQTDLICTSSTLSKSLEVRHRIFITIRRCLRSDVRCVEVRPRTKIVQFFSSGL